MRRILLLTAVAALGLTPVAPAGAAEGGARVPLSISNFRFCPDTGKDCDIDKRAYVRYDRGAVNGTDNPGAWVPVHPGDTVYWTYHDRGVCDNMIGPDRAGCPGHEVQFEKETHLGWIGFIPSRRGPLSIKWTVPTTLKPGTLLRYYCDTNDHGALGLTGALIVK